MLYPYQPVSEERFLLPKEEERPAPQVGFLEIVGILSDLFDEKPVVLRMPGGTALTLLYRDVIYLERDIIDCVGWLSAQVNETFPLCYYGTAETRETAELTISMAEDVPGLAVARVRSVSGRRTGQLHGLGVHLELGGSKLLEHLIAVVEAMPVRLPAVGAVTREHEKFLLDAGLLTYTEGSMFAYFSWTGDARPQELLYTLTAEHKILLWQAFLAERMQPVEFDWLWDTYYREKGNCLLEWELALRVVLEKLGFRVERGEHCYRLVDSGGQERRFDFTRGDSGEKLFLKLLFPVDDK